MSADTPRPTLLVCINEHSSAVQALLDHGVFCVNVLSEAQNDIAQVFSGRTAVRGPERFETGCWSADLLGCPQLEGALVAFSCRTIAIEKVGTHYVIFGGIEAVAMSESGAPLVYARRRYGRFGPIDP